jgi:hypothetical protein
MMDFKPQSQTFSFRLLLDCLAFLGLSAAFGGIVLVANPTGGLIGMPISLLRFSPFHDFLIPGLILGIVFGIGSFAAILALCIRPTWSLASALTHATGEHWAWSVALVIGSGQVIWIVTEMLMLRGVGVLHFLYGGLGLLIVFLTLEPKLRKSFSLGPT